MTRWPFPMWASPLLHRPWGHDPTVRARLWPPALPIRRQERSHRLPRRPGQLVCLVPSIPDRVVERGWPVERPEPIGDALTHGLRLSPLLKEFRVLLLETRLSQTSPPCGHSLTVGRTHRRDSHDRSPSSLTLTRSAAADCRSRREPGVSGTTASMVGPSRQSEGARRLRPCVVPCDHPCCIRPGARSARGRSRGCPAVEERNWGPRRIPGTPRNLDRTFDVLIPFHRLADVDEPNAIRGQSQPGVVFPGSVIGCVSPPTPRHLR